MSVKIKIQQLDHAKDLDLPFYATSGSAGMDLTAAINNEITIKPQERKLIATGIKLELPGGYEAQIRPRSGLALKNGVTVLNSPGTIDSDYRGEIGVILINHSNENFVVTHGMRIAQMVIAPVIQAELELVKDISANTARGDGGFGSTGINK